MKLKDQAVEGNGDEIAIDIKRVLRRRRMLPDHSGVRRYVPVVSYNPCTSCGKIAVFSQ